MKEELFPREEVIWIGEEMAAMAGIPPFEGKISQGESLNVEVKGSHVQITAGDRNALARGLFMASLAIKSGKDLKLSQKRHFRECGAFIDMSRHGVMNIATIRKTIRSMAALGMNMLQLYMEDIYTLPEYPYFGHLRGRYSAEELRALDAYAGRLGVELVPCIQTLAHLGQFLQWAPNQEIKDQPTILMIDDDRSYAFIEAEIRAMRSSFTTRQIHIGMDEAHGVGLGQYYLKHGPSNRFELMNRHLRRVVEICRRYDFQPMMWSDMFFRLGSKTNDYYDVQAVIPESVIAEIPDVRLVYWDYYNSDPKMYETMFREHLRMKPEVLFAGGIWTWSGFLPHISLTRKTMRPALEACLAHGATTVLATMWGDDGTETCYSLSYNLLPLFSETCWTGKVQDAETLSTLGEVIGGIPAPAFEAWSTFYPGPEDQRNGKGFVYCDLLYPLVVNKHSPVDCAKRFRQGCALMEDYLDLPACTYAYHVMKFAAHKAEIIAQLRTRFLAGDAAYLREVMEKEIPALLKELDSLRGLHRQLWIKEFKRHGWEVIALRYGAVEGRLRDVQLEIQEYLDGAPGALDVLREEPLPSSRKSNMQFYSVYVAPTFST